MIELYQFNLTPALGEPNASPFCLKLETYLRMANIPHKITCTYKTGTKGKLPYIKDQNETITDSGLIIDYLNKKYGNKLDADLTDEQKAQALVIRRLIEEHLYWVIVYSRWIEPIGWQTLLYTYFKDMPRIIKPIIAPIIRKGIIKELKGHGIGRHTRDEIYKLGADDLDALATLLGDKHFFLGEQPTTIDACAYGFLANILFCTIDSPLKQAAKKHKNLKDYCHRMQQIYFDGKHSVAWGK